MAIKRPVFVVTLALILGEFLAFFGAHVAIFIVCAPVFLVQKIITKKIDIFFVVIFWFSFVGYCVTDMEINKVNDVYKLKEKQVEVYGTYKNYEETPYGYRYEIENVKMYGNILRKVLVYTSKEPDFKPGNVLKISGKLKHFNEAANYGNFDEKEYYRTLGIYVGIDNAKAEVVNGKYSRFRHQMQRLRHILKTLLGEICNEHNTGLFQVVDAEKNGVFSSVILGDNSGLDENIKNMYQLNGIAHVLAISGLHISAIGITIYKILRKRFKFIFSGSVSMLVVLGFVFMTGEGISAIRAAGMFIFYLLSQMLGRKYDMLSAMSFVTLCVCLSNPFIICNAAFQMSFGAIAGIIFVNPVVGCFFWGARLKMASKKEINSKNNPGEKLKFIVRNGTIFYLQSMLLSLCINLVLLPIMADKYYQISRYSIILNILVIPFMTVVLGSALVALCVGITLTGFMGISGVINGMWLNVLRIIILPGCLILEWYEWLCDIFSKLPKCIYVTGKPGWMQIVLYYSMLFVVLLILRVSEYKRREKNKSIENNIPAQGRKIKIISFEMQMVSLGKIIGKTVALVIFFSLLLEVSTVHNNKLQILFNDVGQGDSIVIKKSDFVMVIDSGSTDVKNLEKYRLRSLLKAKGVSRVDYFIVTHTDTDHISGLVEMLQYQATDRVVIDKIVLPVNVSKDANYDKIVNAAREVGTTILYIDKEDVIKSEGMVITCIHPADDVSGKDKNSQSVVLDVRYREFSMLLTGDISAEEEDILLSEIERMQQKNDSSGYSVLKVAHHGSRYSSSEEFLKRVRPTIAVISCGRDNSYGHPHDEVLERLKDVRSKVLRTDVSGQVVVEIDGVNMEITEMYMEMNDRNTESSDTNMDIADIEN